MIHRVQGFSVVNEVEVDVFLEFCCFFCDSVDVGNLISDSTAFSKSSLYICKFLVHVLLKPSLKDFEHYLANIWNEHSCAVVWTFFGIRVKTDLFQSCGHCWVFQMCWHIECSTLTASYFRIRNSSAGIPSPPLALFAEMLLRPTWFLIPGCLALAKWPHHHIYLRLKHPSLMRETRVRSLDWEDPLEKEMVTHSSILA